MKISQKNLGKGNKENKNKKPVSRKRDLRVGTKTKIMATFSTSIKGLTTAVDNADATRIESQSASAVIGSNDDKLKFICDNKQIIFKAIDLAKIFTGPKGDKILDTLKSVIESLCA